MIKKAQAAMEFLMTYGWAVLVVLAAIGALAYFGVLSPGKFLPEKCTLPPGVACLDSKITNSSVELIMQNSFGRDLTINSISLNNCTEPFNVEFNNGDKYTFIINCNTGVLEEKYKADIIIEYTAQDTGMQKNILGDLVGRIQ